MRKSVVSTVLALTLLAVPQAAGATGTWTGGQDTLHVPMAWCVVGGSPAEANPNLAGDTATDDLIWRRHERPTDNIFVNPTGITLRSAILNAWQTLDYPIINDPNPPPAQGGTGGGVQGDVRGEDVNTFGNEFTAGINACDQAYAGPQYGLAGIGVTAVNVGLFHDAAGNYVGVIGWGGCAQDAGGDCAAPYTGRIMVVDNIYLHPASPSRTFPGSNLQFPLTDPLDQLVGHEVGHALSLPHVNDVTNLMNPNPRDNDGDGQVDNIAITAAQAADLRTNAVNVPGVEIDPPGTFLPGPFLVMRQPTTIADREEELPSYQDLASVRASLDRAEGIFQIDQQLLGLFDEESGTAQYWSLIDTDGPGSGFSEEELLELGVPDPRGGRGADFVAVVEVDQLQVDGRAWRRLGDEVIDVEEFRPQLLTLVLYPYLVEGDLVEGLPEQVLAGIGLPVYHIVNFGVPADLVGVREGEPFLVRTVNGFGDLALDGLADAEGGGVEFVLEEITFPHCFQESEAKPGGAMALTVEGLRANAPIHALLGADSVYRGATDADGSASFELPIPETAAPGFHLATVGVDGTALTADCVVEVLG